VARRLQKDGYGTGAAYTDVNGDGVLDVFISHGESSERELFKIVQYLVMECNCVRKITEGLFRKYSTL
jgi:hypothetical protein